MEIIITIKDGDELVNSKVVRKQETATESVSQYAKFFDKNCPSWSNNSEYNLMFLKQVEKQANAMLRAKKTLLLNDVYDILGISRSKAGCIVGWHYDEQNPTGDNYVDFDLYADRNSDFINGLRTTVLLDFNVDGCVLDYIGYEYFKEEDA